MLELLEYRHDWAAFTMTIELMKYVVFTLIPDVVFHSAGQDEEQVTDHYDRGDDFHEWYPFLSLPLSRIPVDEVRFC